MDVHYNAFISYRHHPDDIRVASEVHRSLERFHVPGPLRKRQKKIAPIFRDKEELPITSDLNDDIEYALKNSDFLIVICSVHTKESVWVQREIDLFLQTHDRNYVLTVLASGEPYDVIPENLIFEDVVNPETGEVTRIEHEPLSCDWRMPLKKAKQEELPRLAAALLRCRYDELRQRQKQYRTRRATAIIASSFAALLCLSAYFLYTSITIQKANEQIAANLNKALLNQSQHLVTAADELLREGDRFTAIALSVAALPSEGNERPYLPAAERSLIAALDLYSPRGENFAATGVFSLDEGVTINDLWLSKDKQFVYTVDNRKVLTCWNAETFACVSTLDLDGYSVHFSTAEGNIVCRSQETYRISCFAPDGTLLWESAEALNLAQASDGKTILCLDFDDRLCFISSATGEPTREAVILPTEETKTLTTSPSISLLSEYDPELPVPIVYYVRQKDPSTGLTLFTTQSISVFDPKDSSVTPIAAGFESLGLFSVTPDGKLLFTADSRSESQLTGRFEDNRINSPTHEDLYCYNIATQKLLWKTEVTSYSFAGFNSLLPIPESNRVLCQIGQSLYVFDTDTGETISTCETGSPVIYLRAEADRAWAILQDGYLCAFVYDSHYCFEQKCLAGPLVDAAIGKDFYGYALGSSQITAYRPREANPAWQHQLDDYLLSPIYMGRDTAAFEISDNLYLFDLEAKTLRSKEAYPSLEILGFSNDRAKLWCITKQDDTETLLVVDANTGKAQTIALPTQEDSPYGAILDSFSVTNGILSYVDRNYERAILHFFDLNKQTLTASLPLDPIVAHDQSYGCKVIGQTGQYAWLWVKDGRLLEVNTTSGEATTVYEGLQRIPSIWIKEDGTSLAIAALNEVCIKVPGSTDSKKWSFVNAKIGSICMYGNQLLLLCNDGFLYRCDRNGNILSQTQLECVSSFGSSLTSVYDPPSVTWDFTDNNRLVLTALDVANVIDCEHWALCNAVTDCIAYRTEDNSFLCHTDDTICGFPSYTLSELLQLANEQLKNFQLTQAQKIAYGID